MLLLLLCAAGKYEDYVALKALYEATGGRWWTDNENWDTSNTDVCEQSVPPDGPQDVRRVSSSKSSSLENR